MAIAAGMVRSARQRLAEEGKPALIALSTGGRAAP